MRVLIVGGGGLGTVYAGYLARAGVEVTLFVKPEQAARFDDAAVHITGLAELRAPVRLATAVDELGPQDYLLVCVKGRDTEAALTPLRGTPVDTVLSFQNGVRKDEMLTRLFGRERVLGATSAVGGTLLRPGHARHTLAMVTQLGELDGGVSPRAERLAAAIREAGLPAECVPDIVNREWDKLAIYLRTAVIAAITRRDIASVLLDPDLVRLSARTVKEVAAVAVAEGHPIGRGEDGFIGDVSLPEEEMVADLRRWAYRFQKQNQPTYPSMAQDAIAGRPSELEDTAGDVLARASRHGVPAPVLSTCVHLLRAIERTAAGGAPG
jgi:2-dehydropantoate 2-reductase